MASGNLTTSQRHCAFDKNQNIEKQRQTLMRIVISVPANMAEFNMTCQLTLPFRGRAERVARMPLLAQVSTGRTLKPESGHVRAVILNLTLLSISI